MLLISKLIAGYSASMVNNLGYEIFFILTTIKVIPVIFFIFKIKIIINDR